MLPDCVLLEKLPEERLARLLRAFDVDSFDAVDGAGIAVEGVVGACCAAASDDLLEDLVRLGDSCSSLRHVSLILVSLCRRFPLRVGVIFFRVAIHLAGPLSDTGDDEHASLVSAAGEVGELVPPRCK
jgi:hypothetical protein